MSFRGEIVLVMELESLRGKRGKQQEDKRRYREEDNQLSRACISTWIGSRQQHLHLHLDLADRRHCVAFAFRVSLQLHLRST